MSTFNKNSIDYQSLYDQLRQRGYQADRDDTSHIRPYASWIKRHLTYCSVLDIGCGSGGSFRLLGGKHQTVSGVDVSHLAVQKGTALGRNVVQASVTDLPFTDNCFDLVVSSDVFEHLHQSDVDTAVHEAVRVSNQFVFMKIATRVDAIKKWKRLAGHPLHLTINPIQWWIQRFERWGEVFWQDDHAFALKKKQDSGD